MEIAPPQLAVTIHVEPPALQRIYPRQDASVIVADLNGNTGDRQRDQRERRGAEFCQPEPRIRPE